MSNIFAKAAEILMTEGHVKGSLKTTEGFCAIGALQEAWVRSQAFDDMDYARASADAELRLEATRPAEIPTEYSGLAPLARWNDAPERSAEDVILLFKEMAAEE